MYTREAYGHGCTPGGMPGSPVHHQEGCQGARYTTRKVTLRRFIDPEGDFKVLYRPESEESRLIDPESEESRLIDPKGE